MATRPLTQREKRLFRDIEILREELVASNETKMRLAKERDRNESLRVALDQEKTRVIRLGQSYAASGDKLSRRLVEATKEKRRLRNALTKATTVKLSEMQVELKGMASVFPPPLVPTAEEIVTDRVMVETLEALIERRSEFGSAEEMMMVGIGMNPLARRHFDKALDAYWKRPPFFSGTNPFVVGSGVHAAIFSAVRSKLKGTRTVVYERSERAGGSFAVSSNSAFYLNSRNRPGPLSIPGDEFGALNVLPGAPIQPSQISGGEYITNDAIAWVIRMTLLKHAEVFTGQEVTQVQGSGSLNMLYLNNRPQGPVLYGPAFLATGLGESLRAFEIEHERYLSFKQFMQRMDSNYPLRGMRRVAVLGAGDGGKTVIEALTGQGPSTMLSTARMDFPEKIDWWGVPANQRSRETWEACNRSRYKGIGRLLPRSSGAVVSPYRVLPLDQPSFMDVGYDCIKLNGMPYDFVIDCTGYASQLGGVVGYVPADIDRVFDGQNSVGRKYNNTVLMGPAAQIGEERAEALTAAGVPENIASIFRYADKTARLAEIS